LPLTLDDGWKRALPWHGAVYGRCLAISPIPPPQRDKTAHFAVRLNNARFSIFSLKAEADRHLRVGKKALWFVYWIAGRTKPRGDEQNSRSD
jgi:hypothetical protein